MIRSNEAMSDRAHLPCVLVACLGSALAVLPCGLGRAAGTDDGRAPRLDVPSLASADGSLRVQPVVLLQPMALLHVDESVETATEGSGFALRKAEAGIAAHVGRAVHFKLVGGLEGGEAVVVDAYVHVDPLDGALALRAGFFKPPFARQFVLPDSRRQLAEGALALDIAAPHEQLGAQLGGVLFDVLDYRVGAWIAGDRAFAANSGSADDPLVGGRLSLQPLGPVGEDEEPDLAWTSSPRFSLGGSLLYDRRGDRFVTLAGLGDVGYSDHRVRVGGELSGKWRGASLASEVFFSRVWPVSATPVEIADRLPPVRGLGGYLQAGYFVVRGLLEIALRFDAIDPDLEIAGWGLHPALGVQIYGISHMLKMMVMYRINLEVDDPYPPASTFHTPTTHDGFLVLQAAF